MKTMLAAAIVALSLGTFGTAYADGEGGPAATFSTVPTEVIEAQSQEAPRNPPVATAQSGQAVQTYATHANQGTWLFPPAQNGNG